jgi:hypothetical protein
MLPDLLHGEEKKVWSDVHAETTAVAVAEQDGEVRNAPDPHTTSTLAKIHRIDSSFEKKLSLLRP